MGLCAGKSSQKVTKDIQINNNNNNGKTNQINGIIIEENEDLEPYLPTKASRADKSDGKSPSTANELSPLTTHELVLDEKRNSRIVIAHNTRDSFGRFDDQLCQLILAGLPLRHKLQLECVSQQWRRCVFRGQTRLCLEFGHSFDDTVENLITRDQRNVYTINNRALQAVLQKCSNIKRIETYSNVNYGVNDQVLNIIADNCRQLEIIRLPLFDEEIGEQCLDKFGEACGQLLREIRFYSFSRQQFAAINDRQKLNRFLAHCPNLTSIFESKISLSVANKQPFPALAFIEIRLETADDLSELSLLADRYSEQITKVKVHAYFNVNFCDFDQTMAALCRFSKLEDLDLSVYSTYSVLVIHLDVGMAMIANRCALLRKIRFKIAANFKCLTTVFNIFGNFRALESLIIVIKQNSVNFGTLEPFSAADRRLTHLELDYQYLKDDNLSDIGVYCGQLKTLIVETKQELSDRLLRSLSGLSNLKKVRLSGFNEDNMGITDTGVCHLINSCPTIADIYFTCNPSISRLALENFIEKARLRPRVRHRLTVGFYKSAEFQRYFDGQRPLPDNLTFNAFF